MATWIIASMMAPIVLVILNGCSNIDDPSKNPISRMLFGLPNLNSGNVENCYAEIYQHGGFNGWKATYPVGEYNFGEFLQRGARNDAASSIKVVGDGCKAILYQHAGFRGWTVEFPAGEYRYHKFIRQGARNDGVSSVKVMQVPTSMPSASPDALCHETTFTCDAIAPVAVTECWLDYEALPQGHCPDDDSSWGQTSQCDSFTECDAFAASGYCGCASCAAQARECYSACGFDHPLPLTVGSAPYSLELGPYHSLGCAAPPPTSMPSASPDALCHETTFTCDAVAPVAVTECWLDYEALPQGHCPDDDSSWGQASQCDSFIECDAFAASGYCGCASCAAQARECYSACGFDHPLPLTVGSAPYSLELGPYHSLGCA